MILHTVVRDCLYLNWALPAESLPPLPEGLAYERHGEPESAVAFASLVLFRQEELHHEVAPFLRLAYPQCNLRSYVRDRDGGAAVFFHRMYVPSWVVLGARLVGRQPAGAAGFDYPAGGPAPAGGPWSWRVEADGAAIEVRARPGAGLFGHGASLGSWQATVAYFRERPRGYGVQGGQLRGVEAIHPTVEHAPVAVELGATSLLERGLPEVSAEAWTRPHSAFLCPRVPFVFALGTAPRGVLAGHLLVPG